MTDCFQDSESITIKITSDDDSLTVIHRFGQDIPREEYPARLKELADGGAFTVPYNGPHFPATVWCSTIQYWDQEEALLIGVHRECDLWTVIHDEQVGELFETAWSIEFISKDALNERKIFTILRLCHSCTDLEISIFNSHSHPEDFTADESISLPNLRSLKIHFDDFSKKNRPTYHFCDAFCSLQLTRLQIEGVPLTACSLHALCSSTLSLLSIAYASKDELVLLVKEICATKPHIETFCVNKCDTSDMLQFPSSISPPGLALEHLSLKQMTSVMHACHNRPDFLFVTSPQVPWLFESFFLKGIVELCSEVPNLAWFESPWLNESRMRELLDLWKASGQQPLRQFIFDQHCRLTAAFFDRTWDDVKTFSKNISYGVHDKNKTVQSRFSIPRDEVDSSRYGPPPAYSSSSDD